MYSNPSPIVRTNRLAKEYNHKLCFYSVNFPSREELPLEAKGSRIIIETTDPFISVGEEKALWEIHCLVTLPDGSITRTVLGVNTPLRAGQLKIIQIKIDDEGVAHPNDSNVGVSVALDWNKIEYPDTPLGE